MHQGRLVQCCEHSHLRTHHLLISRSRCKCLRIHCNLQVVEPTWLLEELTHLLRHPGVQGGMLIGVRHDIQVKSERSQQHAIRCCSWLHVHLPHTGQRHRIQQ